METRDGWGLLYIGIEVLRVLIKGVKVMRNLLRDAKQVPLTSGGFRGSVTYISFKTSHAMASQKDLSDGVCI